MKIFGRCFLSAILTMLMLSMAACSSIPSSGSSSTDENDTDTGTQTGAPTGTTEGATTDQDAPVDPVVKEIADAFAQTIDTVPAVHAMEDFNPTGTYEGIQAIWYEGMDRNGQKTKVFAYIGFPEGASKDNPVPAVVLVHGGNGHAYANWVKMWTARGYAAIAMDNTGYFPNKVNAGTAEGDDGWSYGLPAALSENGYTSAPNNDGMNSSSGAVSNMWMYHAVGQSILAHNILRADSRVDKERIGITGVSWGGVITSLTIGYDTRYAFAIPIYGSGYLDESLGWIKAHFSGADTKKLWLAQDRFDRVTMPVLWYCWDSDSPFSLNSNVKSYLDTIGNNEDTRLIIRPLMGHSHGAAWARSESYIFADSITKGTAKLTAFTEQPTGRDINLTLKVASGAELKTATVYYITDKMSYSASNVMNQTWETQELTISGNTIQGNVPAEAKGYYIVVTTNINRKQTASSSIYVELD